MKEYIKESIKNSAAVKEKMLLSCVDKINDSADVLVQALKSGNKVMICGNGGSAADAQHMAAELVVRFKKNRRAFPSVALTTDTSIMTACANDFSYEEIFSRQIEAIGLKGDVLIGISTSGNSPNVIKAIESAKQIGIKTIGLTGEKPSELQKSSDVCISIPSQETARIQECHILCIHILCDIIEQNI